MVSKTKSRVQPGSLLFIPGAKFLGCQSQKSTAMVHKAQKFRLHVQIPLSPKEKQEFKSHMHFKKGLRSSETNTFFFRAATDFSFSTVEY